MVKLYRKEVSVLPTTYAHYRFGRDVLAQLPTETQALINRHRDLFDFGVHGPDLLFYYKPLIRNHVNRTGYRDHERTGRDFFTEAAGNANAAPDREAALSYLYGVLCHFALDRCCHPYVAEKEREGVSHSTIEASFDRYLLLRDGLDPVTHKVTAHLHPSRKSAGVIALFYPFLTVEEVFQAENHMLLFLNALIAKGPKRRALLRAMHLADKAQLGDLFIPYDQVPACADSDRALYGHYREALELAEVLFRELEGVLEGTGDFGPGFDHTFGAK